jgi:hypothetical protein
MPSETPTAKVADASDAEAARGWGDAPGSAPARAFLPPVADSSRSEKAQRDPAVSRAIGRPDAASAPLPIGDARQPSAEPSDSPPDRGKHESLASASDRWAALSQRMRALGVEHYSIEGNPGSAVRFRCTVPLANQSAVCQQFEAEAGDVFSAVEIALRRVVLWRSTEDQ